MKKKKKNQILRAALKTVYATCDLLLNIIILTRTAEHIIGTLVQEISTGTVTDQWITSSGTSVIHCYTVTVRLGCVVQCCIKTMSSIVINYR